MGMIGYIVPTALKWIGVIALAAVFIITGWVTTKFLKS